MAVALVVVVGIALGWFVVVRQFEDELDSPMAELSTDCEADHADVTDAIASFDPLPDDEQFDDVRAALRRQLDADRWAMELRGNETDEPEMAFVAGMVADGGTYEFRRSDGARGLVSPDGALTSAPDSSFWIGACPNSEFLPWGLYGPTGCYDRVEDGEMTTVRYRMTKDESCDDEYGVALEASMRGDRFERFAYTVTTESGSSTTELRPVAAEDVADPWPWQVVPGWFVSLVA